MMTAPLPPGLMMGMPSPLAPSINHQAEDLECETLVPGTPSAPPSGDPTPRRDRSPVPAAMPPPVGASPTPDHEHRVSFPEDSGDDSDDELAPMPQLRSPSRKRNKAMTATIDQRPVITPAGNVYEPIPVGVDRNIPDISKPKPNQL